MRNLLFWLFVLVLKPYQTGYAQPLFPAYSNEISYQDNLIYFNGIRFSGLLLDAKSRKTMGEVKNGYKHGMFTEYYDNGTKKNEGQYSYGKVDGVYIQWYEDGRKKSETVYADGHANGSHRNWAAQGTLVYEGNYVSGLKDGQHTSYYPNNGNKKTVVMMSRDKINGLYIDYYENGNKKTEYTSINDLNQGEYSEWFENGVLKVKYDYTNGKIRDGKYIIFDITGAKAVEEEYKDGVKIKEGVYKEGDLYDMKTEYYSGTRIKWKEGLMKNELRDGLWTEYFEDGKLKSESQYAEGELNGEYKEWYDNGDQKIVATYLKGVLARTTYENLVDPSNSVQAKLKSGSYLFRITSFNKADTAFIMVLLGFGESPADEELKKRILQALELRCDLIRNSEIAKYNKQQLSYSISFSQPRYSTVYDDGKSSISLGVAVLNTQVSPGYRGTFDIAVTFDDLINNTTLIKIGIEPRTPIIYPSKSEAYANAYTANLDGLISQVYKTFPVKLNISTILEKDKKGLAKFVLADRGVDLGLRKKFTFWVFESSNKNQHIGIIEIDETHYSNSTCKVIEGNELITACFNTGKKLFALLKELK